MRAVPSEAPRFWAAPWRPPASFVFPGGADDMITLPSCDINRPAPTPNSASESLNPVSFSSTSIVLTRTRAATTIAARPICTTSLGARRADSFGPASAAISIVTDIGSSRLPVSKASRPEDDLEVDGEDEEGAHQHELLRHQRRQTRAERLDAQQRAVEQRVLAEPLPPLLPNAEGPEQEDTADDQERHQREPERSDLLAPDRGSVERQHPAPRAALKDAEDDQAKTHGGEGRADDVELRRVLRSWRRLHPVSHDEDGKDDHDLPHEHEPPRVVRRHPATDHRADRDRRAGDTADDPVGERTVLPLDSSPRPERRWPGSPARRRGLRRATSRRAGRTGSGSAPSSASQARTPRGRRRRRGRDPRCRRASLPRA